MKKLLVLFSIFTLGLTTASENSLRWGQNGHRVTGHIAEQYLTDKAAGEIKRVLKNESLAKVSTWMDEVRSDDSYDYMVTWHYVTIPEDETYESAEKEEDGDILWAIEKMTFELKSGNLSEAEEAENLKVLVHLVGDLHQPLHVGNGTDRGGNDIRVEWFWEDSNLHRVWDSEMIESKQLSFTELSDFINHPTKEEINEWQSTSVLAWAKESQELLSKVYDLPEDNRLSYEYAFKNWESVEHRLLQAGVRLAGLINEIYK